MESRTIIEVIENPSSRLPLRSLSRSTTSLFRVYPPPVASIAPPAHPQETEHIARPHVPFRLLFFISLVSLSEPITDTADTAMSLSLARRTSAALVVPASLLSMASVLGATYRDTLEVTHENYLIFKRRKFPYAWAERMNDEDLQHEWPTLSRRREYSAILISIPLILWNCTLTSTATFYFVDAIPFDAGFILGGWRAISCTVTLWSAITALFEATQYYKAIRQLLGGQRLTFTHRTSEIVSRILGPFLGSMKCLQSMVQSYITVGMVLKITQAPFTCIVGSALLITSIPNLIFDISDSSVLVDELFRYAKRGKFDPWKILSFLTALGVTSWLEYLKMPLTIDFCRSTIQNLQGDPDILSDEVYECIATLVLIEAATRLAYLLGPTIYWLGQKSIAKIGALFAYAPRDRSRTPSDQIGLLDEDEDEWLEDSDNTDEEAPALESRPATHPKRNKNINTFFKDEIHMPKRPEAEKAQRRSKQRCLCLVS